jgi:hypothetical protein
MKESAKVNGDGHDYDQDHDHYNSHDAHLLLLAGDVLILRLHQILSGLVHVPICVVNVGLHLIESLSLGNDQVLHILVHSQGVFHPLVSNLDLFLLYLDHELAVEGALVDFQHLNLCCFPAILFLR